MRRFIQRELKIATTVLISAVCLIFASDVLAQSQCLNNDEAKKIIDSFSLPPATNENKDLRKELLAMKDEQLRLNAKIGGNLDSNLALIPESNRLGEQHLLRICQILKAGAWPTQEMIKDDGAQALSFLIMNNKAFQAQRELLPVLVEASKKGYVERSLLAVLTDGIRVGLGAPQLFGTQAAVRSEAIYLYPLANDTKVDEWRKDYGLPPLSAQIRAFENRYGLPLLKLHRSKAAYDPKDKSADAATLGITGGEGEGEVVTVNTQIVSLNVRVDSKDQSSASDPSLGKDDFLISENGVEQQIDFFASTEKPIDLVLVLDFSGSTDDKRGLIKKAATRFVASTRPQDRVAVVAFGDDIEEISDLVGDKTGLPQLIKNIKISGVSPIWDSLSFTFQNVIDKQTDGRRSSIIIMSDGLDNSENSVFADLVENVRRRDTTIFSVCLPPESRAGGYERRGERSLQILSDESGGTLYNVRNIKDLDGVYDQVIKDLATVYSIGYEPKNSSHDGKWREVSVKIKDKPNLIAKTRRGYYSN